MATSKSSPQSFAAQRVESRRVRMTAADLLTLSDEERIRRIYDMTPEQAEAIIRKSGILTASGKLKRGYR
ncbi:hypothetical protein [uncultured Stenotrophomonas sp.]|uniref:hypothetical protein n=1 Tax=uncultured Stenotrophomonas sp. TaxID=165438 RepID=UPI0028D20C90|nr:hypothetical protein [uncultured Stenotrophomonas sp.]